MNEEKDAKFLVDILVCISNECKNEAVSVTLALNEIQLTQTFHLKIQFS